MKQPVPALISFETGEVTKKIRILIVATNKWSSIGQFLSALIHVGFDIAVVSPPGSPIEHIKKISGRYKYSPLRSHDSIRRAIADWAPFLIVCNDDVAVRELHGIFWQACNEIDRSDSNRLIELIELSLGDRRSFAGTRSKSRVLSAAQRLKINCPPTIFVDTHKDVDSLRGGLVYPVLIKMDESSGGRGIRLARNEHELKRAVLELSFPNALPNALKRPMASAIQRLPARWSPRLPEHLSLQRFIGGRPANRAVVCWQGKILAGVSIEAIETDSEFGPTTLARIIDHPELTEAAEKIVESQRLSGFLGFDFVLDHEDRAWFLEMNPRVTPACHLRRFETLSLPAALFAKLTGEQPRNDTRAVPADAIALHPNRVSEKHGLHTYFDDVPEEEQAFVDACRRSNFSRKISGIARSGATPLSRLSEKLATDSSTENS